MSEDKQKQGYHDEPFSTIVDNLRVVMDSRIACDNLAPLSEMPQVMKQSMEDESLAFIERRFKKMQTVRSIEAVNANVFLLMMMAPAYNIHSPYDLAEHIQTAEMPHGDSTGFGRFVEERILPIFGVQKVPEKQSNDQATKTLYSPIDAQVNVSGTTCYTTWKAGPWTMNQSHANEMIHQFPKIHERTGSDIVLGIFYGNYLQLNNKPALVCRETGDWFHVMVGKDLWEFVTGYENAHLAVVEAIRAAQNRFADTHGGKTFFEHMLETRLALTQSIREAYSIDSGDDDLWAAVVAHGF